MLSWNNIRTACAVLLLVPVVHLAYLLSREAMATLDPSPSTWAREMQAYARADQGNRQRANPLLVVGGQRVKLWHGLEDLLAPKPVLMRGLGDATVNDILYYYDRLIGFYRPQTLVLLPGNSEFHIRDMKSAEELVATIQSLAAVDANRGSTRHFYIFTPLKTPFFPGDNTKIEQASDMLQQWADQDSRITILDANRLLSDMGGRAKPDFYRGDGINLNENGYLRLSIMLQNQVERDATATDAVNTDS